MKLFGGFGNFAHEFLSGIKITFDNIFFQAWFETRLAGCYTDSAFGSKTAMSSSFTLNDSSSAEVIGHESKLESTYLYIQMEYCPR